MTSLEDLIEQLAADPLYQLSTAGQELFHTNMLFWLATQRPGPSTPVWHALHADAPPSEGPDSPGPIRREWRHIDLYLDSGMGGRKLVLENKVLSVPNAAQLTGYHDKLLADPRIKHAAPVTSWVLLTLLPVGFDAPAPWRVVSYAELLGPLEQTALALAARPETADDAVLITAYTRLIHRLVELADRVDITSLLDEPIALPAHLRERLHGVRLSALVQKMRITRCLALLEDTLRAEQPHATLPPLNADLTRGEVLLEAFIPCADGRQFGWQLQGGQIRLVMITSPNTDEPTAAGRDEAAARHSDYFTFDDLEPQLVELLAPYTGKKAWLGYGHTFVYRYRPLREHTTWNQLLDLLAALTARSRHYVHAHDRATG